MKGRTTSRRVVVVLALAVLGGLVAAAFAQDSGERKREQPLTIQKVMTPEQLKNTGVAGLKPDQRKALDLWLNEYTARVIKVTLKSRQDKAKAYAGVGPGHWVKKVIDRGNMVLLEDRSLWEVAAIDRINTMLWLPITSITVTEARVPVGEFKYVLINTDDGETAHVKYLGKQ